MSRSVGEPSGRRHCRNVTDRAFGLLMNIQIRPARCKNDVSVSPSTAMRRTSLPSGIDQIRIGSLRPVFVIRRSLRGPNSECRWSPVASLPSRTIGPFPEDGKTSTLCSMELAASQFPSGLNAIWYQSPRSGSGKRNAVGPRQRALTAKRRVSSESAISRLFVA